MAVALRIALQLTAPRLRGVQLSISFLPLRLTSPSCTAGMEALISSAVKTGVMGGKPSNACRTQVALLAMPPFVQAILRLYGRRVRVHVFPNVDVFQGH